MANAYHRPLLALYLPTPPRRRERGEDFRTTHSQDTQDDARLDALVREVQVRHSTLLSALEDVDALEKLPFVASKSTSDGVDSVAASITKTLAFDITEFRKGSYEDALRYARNQAEEAGIYVLLKGDLGSWHSKIPVASFRGFALADSSAPFVLLNDNDAKPALVFTLFHELAHIWLGASGISGYGLDLELERFCNAVAGRILVHPHELALLGEIDALPLDEMVDAIQAFARERNVSGLMVTYGLMRDESLSWSHWQPIQREIDERWRSHAASKKVRNKDQKGGPNYYTLRRFSSGDRLVGDVRRLLEADVITTVEAGVLLGVRPTNVSRTLESA